MGMPMDIGVIDLMMGIRAGAAAEAQYDFMKKGLHDQGSASMRFPAEYMFKDVPHLCENPPQGADLLLPHMDRHGVEKAMIGVGPSVEVAQQALRDHPDRFIASYEINPNKGMDAVRMVVRMYEEWGIKALTVFPAGYLPQVPVNDKKMYPFYAKCVELDIPIFCCAGVPGPRVPFKPQHVALIDEVMY